MLHVQEYLKPHTLAELKEAHGIKNTLSASKHKMSLNYDQIESKESDPLACQCRGLIIAKVDGSVIDTSLPIGETVVLARPMDRFFNYGQGSAKEIDFSDPETVYLEKLDGTLGILYRDIFTGEWCVGTRSVPEADHLIDGFGTHTFRTLFEVCLWETLRRSNPLWFQELQVTGTDTTPREFFKYFTQTFFGDSRATLCWEITSPLNRVVVDYKDYGITLLAVRYPDTGEEKDPKYVVPAGLPTPKTYSFGVVAELLEFVASKEPSQFEGVVVRARNLYGYDRLKVKNPAYLAFNRIRDSVANSPRALMEVIMLGKHDDVFPMLPQSVQDTGQRYLEGFKVLSVFYEGAYDRLIPVTLGSENPRKSLALKIQEEGLWLPPLMMRFSGKVDSFQSFLESNKKEGTWNDSFLDTVIDNAERIMARQNRGAL